MELFDIILSIIPYLVAIFFAAISREFFKGLMALRYGDNTPKIMNRITFNPLKHIDIFGLIVLPITLLVLGAPFMFGYAKPMTINFTNIEQQSGFRGCILVAWSGIFLNLFLTFCVVVLLKLGLRYNFIIQDGFIFQFLFIMIYSNILLVVFNLLPFPPLDGAKILAYTGLFFHTSIFARWYNNLEKYGMILIILLLLFPLTQNGIVFLIEAITILFLQL
ncbi:site-2 protease family protein [Helicobacter didelphidarum]|uniref:Site-2 protease family protein n=1 Tax=Helicobacter didelphidarum TaxID=2040648 RepID=A0A3D8IQN2_9HELI|nr:site-2 protease family protein [Helicobacter didelphidarum]RDU67579.1 site-2 protease family protein [Helicobacter didelphidarum]